MEKELHENSLVFSQASQTKRMLNYFIDTIVSILFYFIMLIVIMLIMSFFSTQILHAYSNNMILQYITVFTILFFYYYASEKTRNKTIGKYITKSRVISKNGDPLTNRQLLIRTLVRFIPFEPFSFLFSIDTGWHDKLSNTTVVNDIQQ